MFNSVIDDLWAKFWRLGDPASPEYRLATKHVDMVGTELEGVFDIRVLDAQGISLGSDGSVTGFPDSLFRERHMKRGEIAFHDTVNALRNKFLAVYPVAVNQTCGFHIHVSFQDYHKAVFNLGDRKFLSFLHQGLSKFLELDSLITKERQLLANRLSGTNNFCGWDINILKRKQKDKPTTLESEYRETHALPILRGKQINATSKCGERYAMLNFCHKLHNTLEMRAYPMFDLAPTGYTAVCWYVYLVEQFMDMMEKYENKTLYKYTLKGEDLVKGTGTGLMPASLPPMPRSEEMERHSVGYEIRESTRRMYEEMASPRNRRGRNSGSWIVDMPLRTIDYDPPLEVEENYDDEEE